MYRTLGHFFSDPLRPTEQRYDVYVELELKRTVVSGARGDEPPDIDWKVIRLSINDFDTYTPFRGRFAKLTRWMMENAS